MSMKRAKRHSIVAGCLFLAMLWGVFLVSAAEMTKLEKRIVYIEASIGRAWKLDQFSERTQWRGGKIQFVAVYDFDKSAAVTKALTSSEWKPDVIVLQECSTYFPGSLDEYKKSYRGWIRQIKEAGATPVIATTVPAAMPSGWVAVTKEFVKTKVLGKTGQLAQLGEFNDWLREIGNQEGIPVLDLERAMQEGANDRSLRKEFDVGDGTHLNEKAYQVLDGRLAELMRSLR
jgi:hypothetical protein